jgi:hypothetical protein
MYLKMRPYIKVMRKWKEAVFGRAALDQVEVSVIVCASLSLGHEIKTVTCLAASTLLVSLPCCLALLPQIHLLSCHFNIRRSTGTFSQLDSTSSSPPLRALRASSWV